MADHIFSPYVDFYYGTSADNSRPTSGYASDFHLYRVSSSKRYNDNLIPSLSDKTAEVPGADGMYFFNSYYKQRQFTVNIAFDKLNDADLREMRNWLNGKDIKDLIFDEFPDVAYKAKVTGTPNLKFVPFDEPTGKQVNNTTRSIAYMTSETTPTKPEVSWSNLYDSDPVPEPGESQERRWHKIRAASDNWTVSTIDGVVWDDPIKPGHRSIYKGDGTITFTCYYPYGESTNEYHSGSKIGGEIPTTFVATTNSNIDPDTTWTVSGTLNGQTSAFLSVTFPQAVTCPTNGSIEWDSNTGLIVTKTSNGVVVAPVNFTGTSYGTIEPGYTVSINMGILTYRRRYY